MSCMSCLFTIKLDRMQSECVPLSSIWTITWYEKHLGQFFSSYDACEKTDNVTVLLHVTCI